MLHAATLSETKMETVGEVDKELRCKLCLQIVVKPEICPECESLFCSN